MFSNIDLRPLFECTIWFGVVSSVTRRFVKKAPNFVKKIAQNRALVNNFLPEKFLFKIWEF
jgi:hypothetical protein